MKNISSKSILFKDMGVFNINETEYNLINDFWTKM